jgi:hypothetical protein
MPKFLSRPWVLIAAAIVFMIFALFAWQLRRDQKVRSFCRKVQVGMKVTDLVKLEEQQGIDSSYLVLFTGIDFQHQEKMPELIFRSHMLDPEFECAIAHKGGAITEAALVPE